MHDQKRVLTVMGYETDAEGVKAFQRSAGLVADGIIGPKTTAALYKIPRRGLLSVAEVVPIFGDPGDTRNFTVIKLPYTMRVAWDRGATVNTVQCHKKIAVDLLAALTEILNVYGLEAVRALGLDLYGGCYAFRKMRGGNSWSKHSWAIAVDLDPDRNTLHEDHTTARFARPEYVAMLKIFYKHGFVNLGVEKDYDWMHMEHRGKF